MCIQYYIILYGYFYRNADFCKVAHSTFELSPNIAKIIGLISMECMN